jgi:hypothetical protein
MGNFLTRNISVFVKKKWKKQHNTNQQQNKNQQTHLKMMGEE